MELRSASPILARLAAGPVALTMTPKGRSAQVRYRAAPRPVTAQTHPPGRHRQSLATPQKTSNVPRSLGPLKTHLGEGLEKPMFRAGIIWRAAAKDGLTLPPAEGILGALLRGGAVW